MDWTRAGCMGLNEALDAERQASKKYTIALFRRDFENGGYSCSD